MAMHRETTEKLEKLAYIEAILDVVEEADADSAVVWRGRDVDRRAIAVCSDFFGWAIADGEEILPGDVPLFQRCLQDLQEIEATFVDVTIGDIAKRERNDAVATAYLSELFAARKRQLRPMRAVYEDDHAIGPRTAALFDDAGPERTDSEGQRRKVYDQEEERVEH